MLHTHCRCTRIVLSGTGCARGVRSSVFSKCACDNLRCLSCNFKVLILCIIQNFIRMLTIIVTSSSRLPSLFLSPSSSLLYFPLSLSLSTSLLSHSFSFIFSPPSHSYLRSLSFSPLCSSLLAPKVHMFLGYTWNIGPFVDYMFFRNNTPNESKLSAQLTRSAAQCAYCCQCSWTATAEDRTLNQGVSGDPQWVCAGH